MTALQTAGRSIATFFSWWGDELAGLIPEAVRRLAVPTTTWLLVDVEPQALSLSVAKGNSERALGRIPLAGTVGGGIDGAPLKAETDSLMEGMDRRGVQCAVRLPGAQVLRKVLSLPAVAEDNLHQVLTFEMDRQTPFAAEDVYFDHQIVRKDRESRRLFVDLAVVRRADADRALDLARALGLVPAFATVAGPQGRGISAFRFQPGESDGGGRRIGRIVTMALGALALALLAATILVPLERKQRAAEEAAAQAAAAKGEAEAVRQLRATIDQLKTQEKFIIERKEAQAPVVKLLDELTRILPDDTWLFRVRIVGAEVQIYGNSAGASALIGLIENSPLFKNVQFRAPVTRDPRLEADRFHIAFEVEKEAVG